MSEQSATSVRAVVAGHGQFAVGIISAVEQITGRGSVFVPVSNAGLCLDDIQGAIARALDDTGATVIFTDLPAGSCTMAVRRLVRERPGTVLVTGINLSLLLDFAMQDLPTEGDTQAAIHSAVQTAVERGRASLAVYGLEVRT